MPMHLRAPVAEGRHRPERNQLSQDGLCFKLVSNLAKKKPKALHFTSRDTSAHLNLELEVRGWLVLSVETTKMYNSEVAVMLKRCIKDQIGTININTIKV